MNTKWVLLLLLFLCVQIIGHNGSLRAEDTNPSLPQQQQHPESGTSLWDQFKQFFNEDHNMTDQELQDYLNERYSEQSPDMMPDQTGPGCSLTDEELEQFFQQYEMM